MGNHIHGDLMAAAVIYQAPTCQALYQTEGAVSV